MTAHVGQFSMEISPPRHPSTPISKPNPTVKCPGGTVQRGNCPSSLRTDRLTARGRSSSALDRTKLRGLSSSSSSEWMHGLMSIIPNLLLAGGHRTRTGAHHPTARGTLLPLPMGWAQRPCLIIPSNPNRRVSRRRRHR